MAVTISKNKLSLVSLYLMAIFLPVTGWAIYYKSFELPFIDLLALIGLIFFSLYKIKEYFSTYHPEKIKLPLFGPFFIFLLVNILSALVNPGYLGSLWYVFRWILFFYLAFIVFPFNVIKDLKVLKRVIILIVVGGFFVALMGLISLFLQDISDTFFRATPLYFWGDWVFGESYNLMAEFLIVTAFLTLSLKYFYKNVRTNRFLDLLFLFFVAIDLLTFGRTAWMTVFLQIFIYVFIYYFLIKKEKINLRESLVVLFFALILISPFFAKALDLQKANVSSTQNRVLLTQISWEAFLEKPMLGHGGGKFVSLVYDNTRFLAKYGNPLDSHGFGQKIIAESGLLGALSFLLFLFLIFRRMYLGLMNHKSHYQLLLPLLVASFGAYFYQLFNTSYYKGRVWLPIALALIAVEIIKNKKHNKKDNSEDYESKK